MNRDPFEKYLKETEPNKVSKSYAWSTAIGLQAVDALEPSKYLIDTARQNIEGKITLAEAEDLINSYYKEKHDTHDKGRTEEADKVSMRIAELLSEKAFSFTPNEYIAIHRKLFQGIYKHAGSIRDYNITKKEWVLDGATVLYGSASELRATLDYDLSQEKGFRYSGISMDETIRHLAVFVSRLWQIHVFGEGNTRTTAVFFIKYLRTLGFSVTNHLFAENSWYFRNALVRANYNDLKKGIHETTEYLELFLRNLLLDEHNELHNRDLHISGLSNKKVDIQSPLSGREQDFSKKTGSHICVLYEQFGYDGVFGRSDVIDLLGIQHSGASKFLKKLLDANLIEPISGMGKGKYQFKKAGNKENWEERV